jgi:N12 class adenine-specific DNA methylase
MSKLQRLRDNIEAIESALKGKGDAQVLNKYTGFGGLGFVLNPIEDKSQWNKTDMVCYEDTVRLVELLREHAGSEKMFKKWMASLRASTLTAYYTPREVVTAIMDCMFRMRTSYYSNAPLPKTMLDPAAGMGVFAKAAMMSTMGGRQPEITMYEKDLLTAAMLKASLGGKTAEHTTVYCDGFEHFPDDELGCYDLVATNVPFGNIAVFDDAYSNSALEVRRDAAQMIHRYFVLKGLDALRDGGIEAYIITSNYLNNDTEQVRYALQQSRLIGAYRLANNLFKENGTEVGTDLLVLQKDSKKQGLTEDEELLCTPQTVEGCPYNAYFVKHNDHLIATSAEVGTDAYGKKGLVFSHKDGVKGIATDMGKRLSEDMATRMDVELFELGGKTAKHTTDAQPVTVTIESAPAAEAAGMVTKKGAQKGKSHKEGYLGEFLDFYQDLYKTEQTTQTEQKEMRESLNYLYDEFVKKYGCLHDQKNVGTVRRVANELLGLEVKTADGWGKADIFRKPVAFSTAEPSGTLTAHEALCQSLNEYGKADMQYIAGLTGMDAETLIKELEGEVFFNPLNGEWEIKAKFLSGDVIRKAAMISQQTEQEGGDSRVAKALEALKAAVPAPIPFEQLDFNLGERWVDVKVYERFAQDFFSMGDSRPGITIRYQKSIDMYAVGCTTGYNEKIRSQYSVESECSNRLNGIDLLTHALHDSTPKLMKYKRDARGVIMYNDNDEELKEEDTEAVQQANDKINEIRQGYCDWLLRQDKATQDKLADGYNRRYNCTVKPQYDGSHLTLADVDWDGVEQKYGFRTPYRSQLDAIWMLTLQGGGIVDHEVGGGKTFIMCATCHEMKRMSLVHKPMIIGMKANVSAIAEMYATMYPQDKLLFAKEADYSAQNRVDFFNRMRNNDYDCIVMSHDQFGKIPQSAEIEEDLLDDELQQLEDALQALSNQDGYEITRKQRKGLEQRKRNLEAKIEKLQDTMKKRKDDVVDFDMMGIDMLFVDESHVFKNLGFSTRHDRVAGIGNTDGSQRAFNLLMALRTIQRRSGKDLGAVFLSGTTVTNSLTELYNLFRYLRPKALERQGITCFDAWAAIFTRKSSEWEFGITNNIQLKERFRYFVKVPELAMFYNEITDYRTAEDVGIDRPKMNRMLLKLQPTPDQEAYIKTLMEFAKTGDFSLIGKVVNEKQEKAKMLYATDLARKMSLDMREIDPMYGDHPGNKATQCAVLVKRYYDAFDPVKGVQLIFCDLSAWKGKEVWSVYGEIKNKLVDMGVPPQEVRFIQEASSDKVKQGLIQQANEGKIRVLFGSTSTLGTGVNVQDRIVAIHELDTPWRPSDMEQREGRGVRKGNWVAKQYGGNKVDVIIYAVERSLDAYKFHLLHCKQVFISQLKRGQLNVRTLDEGDMDEKTGMSFAEYTAVLSGNTDLLERAKLEKKIAAMESAKKLFYREQAKQEQKLKDMQHEAANLERDIPDCQADLDRFEQAKQLDEFGQVVNTFQLNGFTVPDGLTVGTIDWAKAVGTALLELDRSTDTSGNFQSVGHIYGFEVLMRTDIVGTQYQGNEAIPIKANKYFVKGNRIMYRLDNNALDHRSAGTAVAYPLNVLTTKLAYDLDQWQRRLERVRESIRQLQSIAHEEWGKDDELARLKQQLTDLDKRIKRSLDSTSEQQVQQHDDRLPVKFEKRGRDHVAIWSRDLFPLVTTADMRQVIDNMRGWGYLRDTEWRDGSSQPREEMEAEFGTSKNAAEFIEKIAQLQKEREAKKEAA